MRPLRLWARIVAINLVLVAAGTELLGLVWYGFRYHQLFYSRHPVPFTPRPGLRDMLLDVRIHPYFGYTLPDGVSYRDIRAGRFPTLRRATGEDFLDWFDTKTNNHGFCSPVDYPYVRRSPRDYIIGVFGGSVGNDFSRQGQRRLLERLHAVPALADRDIVVLNFSQDGFKQPQQLETLGFFCALGQEFDLVLNVDGFNEIVGGLGNLEDGVESAMPDASEVAPIVQVTDAIALNDADLRRLARVKQARARLLRIREWRTRNYSAALDVLLTLVSVPEQVLLMRYNFDKSQRPVRPEADHRYYAMPASTAAPDSDEGLRQVLAAWSRSSRLMNAMSASVGARYLEILQPNQYYSHKHFSDVERRLALMNEKDPNCHCEPPRYVRRGYAAFPGFVAGLRAHGVAIESATEIFDHVEAVTYADACCHYTLLGNELLADFVAGAIERELARPMPR